MEILRILVLFVVPFLLLFGITILVVVPTPSSEIVEEAKIEEEKEYKEREY